MTNGEEVFRRIQNRARSDATAQHRPTPTAEYLTRHALESFLDRLTRTPHRDNFVLKGGILLSIYGIRRPTKDVDAEAVHASVTPDHVSQIVQEIAAVDVEDGLQFDLSSMTVGVIRDEMEYPGLRMRVQCNIGSQKVFVVWDISTGDPIVPSPQLLRLPRILGGEVEILGYTPETTVAEKGVTILERGITSTRWRDYIDIVQLADRHNIDEQQLLVSARAVARYRRVELRPTASVVTGYGEIGQVKWAAWRRKERLEEISDSNLDDQMARVAAVLDPVFARATER